MEFQTIHGKRNIYCLPSFSSTVITTVRASTMEVFTRTSTVRQKLLPSHRKIFEKMGSHYGNCEIVELEDEPKSSDCSKKNHQERLNDKGKKPQGCSKSIEDDINKLFEAINVRTSFHGFPLSDETAGNTPRRNPSKKPMRMSTSSSSGIGNPEPVSLKQALRGLCISQASEMAAMKRLSKMPGSPALSDSAKLAFRSVRTSNCGTSVAQVKEVNVVIPEESTSSSSRKMPQYPQEIKLKSYDDGLQSSLQPISEKSTKKVPPTVRLNEILHEPESGNDDIVSISSAPCITATDTSKSVTNSSEVKPADFSEKNNYTSIKEVNKTTLKLRRKGRSPSRSPSTRVPPRAVKTVLRNKNIVKKKKKSDQESSLTFNASADGNVNLVPEASQLVCQRCHCALKGAEKEPNEVHFLKRNNGLKRGDKGEFTQSSNSSIGEYSSSTSISEESNLSRCSIGNKPHMSTDIRWQAIHQTMKRDGYLGLRHFSLLKKLGCGDIGTVYLAELVDTDCLFAIKVMDNEFLERRKKMPRAHTERKILRILDHPFLPRLYAHFVSENLSCLVMEYCPGGDLHVLRQKQPGRHYHEQAASPSCLGILAYARYRIPRSETGEHSSSTRWSHNAHRFRPLSSLFREPNPPTILHRTATDVGPCAGSNCIDPFCMKPSCQVSCFSPRILPTHRTRKPKPDPATLRHRSLPQLVAEPTEARSNSFVGTHEYLAPEIIKGEGHGSAVDWWTFGIFLYELLYGRTPFKGSGNDETLANVVLESLKFPETPLVSFQARDLIKGLLVKEPENRLGSERGASEIKQHPFFEGLNWALIRCAVPPEVPENFDIGVAKAKKYLECNGEAGGHLEFELF
ncbi:hypothetical protein OSB04_029885 [Centaurea solstitialis]|uniref:non-specific serine/threonine protein kinase n=1 Tax=Centaurea solstitialis TaxID=347529 RepID=A0AA38VW69_9ASTR|nr:hypothetical protein OSB04_029885 [Centaurea solstitialis]